MKRAIATAIGFVAILLLCEARWVLGLTYVFLALTWWELGRPK